MLIDENNVYLLLGLLLGLEFIDSLPSCPEVVTLISIATWGVLTGGSMIAGGCGGLLVGLGLGLLLGLEFIDSLPSCPEVVTLISIATWGVLTGGSMIAGGCGGLLVGFP